MHFTHLKQLEAESIHIMREVVAEFEGHSIGAGNLPKTVRCRHPVGIVGILHDRLFGWIGARPARLIQPRARHVSIIVA